MSVAINLDGEVEADVSREEAHEQQPADTSADMSEDHIRLESVASLPACHSHFFETILYAAI